MSSAVTSAAADAPRPRKGRSPADIVHASGLPAPLAEQVLAVTGKCRLWPSERGEVARELCAHFLDGLDAGATPEDLAANFGDPAGAAALITTARRRMRPRWWQAIRIAGGVFGVALIALILVYAMLAARFFLSTPRISRNYSAELNAPALAISEADRAWPVYLRAKVEFGAIPKELQNATSADLRTPGSPVWPAMVAWLDEHQDAIATLRLAASKPAMGYVLRTEIDPDLGRAMEATSKGYTYDPTLSREPENPLLVGVLLPHLGEMRRFVLWLGADAARAAELNDVDRFMADIESMLNIARHAASDRFVISTLVAADLARLATEAAVRGAERDGFLSAARLRDLAHTLAAFERPRIDPAIERLTIEDILQRFYSDDGNGDGHFAAGGEMNRIYSDWGLARPVGEPLLLAIQPVQSVLLPSRAELRRGVDRFVAAAYADDQLPPWRHDERSSDAVLREVMEAGVYPVLPALRGLTEGSESPGLIASTCAARDTFEAKRDAAFAVIAMQAYRLEHGVWPAALADLVPSFLPSLPLDPFDGRPLRFVPASGTGGRPLVYSVGADGVDGGGVPPTTRAGREGVQDLRMMLRFRSPKGLTGAQTLAMDASRGDWVLWPEPEAAKEE
jgi:hypothetical protein